MIFNKNIILEILQNNFTDEIDSRLIDDVMDLDSYDYDRVFEYPVDYVEFDEREDITVNEYSLEDFENGKKLVNGIFTVRVLLDGYTRWDGEDVLIDNGVLEMVYAFNFEVQGNQYFKFELENVY